MDITPLSQRPFRFLDLPAELRDAVYDYNLINSTTITSGRSASVQITLSNWKQTNLLLTSCQVRQEYERRAQLAPSFLKFIDHPNYNFSTSKTRRLPPTAMAKFNIFATCYQNLCSHYTADECGLANDLAAHGGWIEEVRARLPWTTSVEMRVSLALPKGRPDLNGTTELLAGAARGAKITVFKSDDSTRSGDYDDGFEGEIYFASWSEAGCWKMAEESSKPQAKASEA